MKKAIGIILILGLVLIAGTALAASSGKCGDYVNWSLNNAGVLTISGSGATYNYRNGRTNEEIWSAASGELPDEYAPWDCSAVKSIVIGNSVTALGEGVFGSCTQCTSVTIGTSVRSIGKYAFSGCEKVTAISLPTSVTTIGDYAFRDCKALEDMQLTGSITSFGEGAFSMCSKLETLTIPEGITDLGTRTFYASGLKNISLPTTLRSIGKSVFNSCSLQAIIIPDSVAQIGEAAFASCYVLKEITVPASVRNIGSEAFRSSGLETVVLNANISVIDYRTFQNCWSLKNIVIPASVTTIRDYAFEYCSSLEGITLPENLQNLGSSAFAYCSSLQEITIPDQVTYIWDYTFYYCTALETVHVPDSCCIYAAFKNTAVSSVDISPRVSFSGESFPATTVIRCYRYSDADYYAKTYGNPVEYRTDGIIAQGTYMGNDGITWVLDGSGKLTITGEGTVTNYPQQNIGWQRYRRMITEADLDPRITKIGANFFNGCANLGSIEISDTVTYIGSYAFQGCSSLQSIHIPSGPVSLYEDVFKGCASLREISIPDTVTNIYNGAFENCTSLTEIVIPDSVLYLGEAFTGCTSLERIQLYGNISEINVTGIPETAKVVIPYGSQTESLLLSEGYDSYYYLPYTPDSIYAALPSAIHIYKTADIQVSIPGGMLDLDRFEVPEILFSSEDPAIATVTPEGKVRGISTGTTEIIAADRLDPFVNTMISVTIVDYRDNILLGPYMSSSYADKSGSAVVRYGCVYGTPPYTMTLELSGIYTRNDQAYNAFSEGTRVVTTENVGSGETLSYSFWVPANDGNTLSNYTARLSVTDSEGNWSYAMIYFGIKYDYGPTGMVKYNQVFDNSTDYSAGRFSALTTPEKLTMAVGTNRLLPVTSDPAVTMQAGVRQEKIVFVSDNPAIAYIDEDGQITTFAAGNTVIHACAIDGSGMQAETQLRVVEALAESIEMTAGENYRGHQTVSAAILPQAAENNGLTWSVSDSSIAEIDQEGNLIWHKKGDVTVTARADDGSDVAGSIMLHFDGIPIERILLALDPENNRQLRWLICPEYATEQELTFQVLNPNVLQVAADGTLTFLKDGTTTIRAKANDGSNVTAMLEISNTSVHEHVEGTGGARLATENQAGVGLQKVCLFCGQVTEAGTEISPQRSLFLPRGIRQIEEESFSGLSGIQQVWIPDGAEAIGDSAFSGCGALVLVRIPASVTSIGAGAFSGATGLCIVTTEGSSAALYAEAKGIEWTEENGN